MAAGLHDDIGLPDPEGRLGVALGGTADHLITQVSVA